MVAVSHENHGLPVLIAARSSSPLPQGGKRRGGLPNARPLPDSRQLLSLPLLLPAPGRNVQNDVTVQSHLVSTVIGTPSAPARGESSVAKDVHAEPYVQEQHVLTQAETGCHLPMESPACGSNAIAHNHGNKMRTDFPDRARKLCWWGLFLIASLFVLSFTFEAIAAAHARLEQSSKD